MYKSAEERRVIKVTPAVVVYDGKALEKYRVLDSEGKSHLWHFSTSKRLIAGSPVVLKGFKIGRVKYANCSFYVDEVKQVNIGDSTRYDFQNLNELVGLCEDLEEYTDTAHLPHKDNVGANECYIAAKLETDRETDRKELKMLYVFDHNYIEIKWDIEDILAKKDPRKTAKIESYNPGFIEVHSFRENLFEHVTRYIDTHSRWDTIKRYFENKEDVYRLMMK